MGKQHREPFLSEIFSVLNIFVSEIFLCPKYFCVTNILFLSNVLVTCVVIIFGFTLNSSCVLMSDINNVATYSFLE